MSSGGLTEVGFGLRPEVVRGTAGGGVQRVEGYSRGCSDLCAHSSAHQTHRPSSSCRPVFADWILGCVESAQQLFGEWVTAVSQPRAPRGGCGRGLGCVSGLRSVCRPGKGFQPPWEAAQCARITLGLKVREANPGGLPGGGSEWAVLCECTGHPRSRPSRGRGGRQQEFHGKRGL